MNTQGIIEMNGDFDARGGRWAIAASRFNSLVVERLVEGAIDALVRHGAEPGDISVCRVPGAFELPFAAREIARSGSYDAVICLGAVVRGETSHYDLVTNETAKGIASVSLETGVPIAFGVLTTENLEQALERAGAKAGNKGFDAAMTAIEMANLKKLIPAR